PAVGRPVGGAAARGEEDQGCRGDAGARAAGSRRGSGGMRDGSSGPKTRTLHHGVFWVGVIGLFECIGQLTAVRAGAPLWGRARRPPPLPNPPPSAIHPPVRRNA